MSNTTDAAHRVYRLLRLNPGPYHARALAVDAGVDVLPSVTALMACVPADEALSVTERLGATYYALDCDAAGTVRAHVGALTAHAGGLAV